MAPKIKNAEVEHLAAELAQMGQTSKTEASREDRLRHFLEVKVWPLVREAARRPWTNDEEDAALGYGPEGLPL